MKALFQEIQAEVQPLPCWNGKRSTKVEQKEPENKAFICTCIQDFFLWCLSVWSVLVLGCFFFSLLSGNFSLIWDQRKQTILSRPLQGESITCEHCVYLNWIGIAKKKAFCVLDRLSFQNWNWFNMNPKKIKLTSPFKWWWRRWIGDWYGLEAWLLRSVSWRVIE